MYRVMAASVKMQDIDTGKGGVLLFFLIRDGYILFEFLHTHAGEERC